MGWGGILGALAQGLGTGMVTNAKEGYEDERLQKKIDWQAEALDKELAFKKSEAELGRQHDFNILAAKEKSEIAVAAAKSQIDVREYKQKLALSAGKGGGKGGSHQADELLRAISINNNALESINHQIQEQGGVATTEQQMTLERLNNERHGLLYSDTAGELMKNPAARQLLIANGRGPTVGNKKHSEAAIDALKQLGGNSYTTMKPPKPSVPEPKISTYQGVNDNKIYPERFGTGLD